MEQEYNPALDTELTKLPGVGPNTEAKLKENGVYTIMAVATRTPGQLSASTGMSVAACRKLMTAARDMCEIGFENSSDIKAKQDAAETIPTYCESIDELLGGGLKTGQTFEAFGGFGCGKTNLSHLFAVSTIKNFPDSYVYWIDTEKTFSAKRLEAYCIGLEVDFEHALEHVVVGISQNSDHQRMLAEGIEKDIVAGRDVKLVIVDGLMSQFRGDFQGRGTLSERQQLVNAFLHVIGKYAKNYGAAVYFTNQMMSDPGQMIGDPNKAIGGHIVSHFAHVRVKLGRGASGTRKMKLVDSPDLPEGEASYKIEENRLKSM